MRLPSRGTKNFGLPFREPDAPFDRKIPFGLLDRFSKTTSESVSESDIEVPRVTVGN